MRPQLIRLSSGFVALALVASAPSVLAGEAEALPPSVANAMAQASPQAIMEYRRKLQEYQEARAAFEQDASAYWGAIADKRRGRNAKRRDRVQITLDDYVLQQPPVYEGPKRPVNPAPEEEGGKPPRPPKTLPVAADLVRAAAEHFQFAPQRPTSEVEFKRAYARYARAAGLTPEQAVRVYSFETGGTGNYDVQAGIEHGGKRAISTAMGFNQLLTTNTVELLAEQGHEFVRDLTERVARTQGPARKAMEHKLAVLKKMVAFTRTVPDDWSAHARLADTPQGWACHAMVLDIDVGPMLQTHKLLTSVIFARNKGYNRPLTAAELEMMNLTGDGTGLDMVTMPQAMREQVPTANFFQRSGYERNPVAIRHNTVARLLAITNERMDFNSNKPGARELAAAF